MKQVLLPVVIFVIVIILTQTQLYNSLKEMLRIAENGDGLSGQQRPPFCENSADPNFVQQLGSLFYTTNATYPKAVKTSCLNCMLADTQTSYGYSIMSACDVCCGIYIHDSDFYKNIGFTIGRGECKRIHEGKFSLQELCSDTNEITACNLGKTCDESCTDKQYCIQTQ
eukprot:342988_1